SIGDKLLDMEHLQSIFWERCRLEWFHRINIYLNILGQDGAEIGCLFVHEDPVPFRVRHPTGLDRVLDRRSFGQTALNGPAGFALQKEWQVAVKREPNGER